MSGIEEVRAAGEAGMGRADEHAPVEWKEAAYAAVVRIARRQPSLTTNHIWAELDEWQPPTPAALGGVLRRAEREGFIVADGLERNRRPRAHRTWLTRWRSLVHGRNEVAA